MTVVDNNNNTCTISFHTNSSHECDPESFTEGLDEEIQGLKDAGYPEPQELGQSRECVVNYLQQYVNLASTKYPTNSQIDRTYRKTLGLLDSFEENLGKFADRVGDLDKGELTKGIHDIRSDCWQADSRIDKLFCIERFVQNLHDGVPVLSDACGFVPIPSEEVKRLEQVEYESEFEGIEVRVASLIKDVLDCLRHK